MIRLEPAGLSILMAAAGVFGILVGTAVGMSAGRAYETAERAVGEQLAALLRLPKLRLVRDLAAAQQQVVRLQKDVGQLTGLAKTLGGDLGIAHFELYEGNAANEELGRLLASSQNATALANERLELLFTGVLALAESWDRLPPVGYYGIAASEMRALLQQLGFDPNGDVENSERVEVSRWPGV
ncbi:hypothetical protein ACFWYW_14500 [Nonomuraea sp. NPDC059023]|uniref:hypothetical protein n=1 Tax=unclassified Nonomuraea TaxID=2593643 RepID=UPI00367E6272